MREPGPLPTPINPDAVRAHLKSVYKAWNAAYRGFVPGGVQMPPPDSSSEYDEPETYADTDYDVTYADPETIDVRNIVPIPVVIMDDLQATRRKTEIDFEAGQFFVGAISPVIIVSRRGSRISLRISNNGPGIVYIGKTESYGTTGYALQVNEAMTLTTTKDVWAIQQTAQTGNADVSILEEYQKEID
jgi:hypothetical protein